MKILKQLLLAYSLIVFGILSVNAQSNDFELGVELGPNVSILYGNDILKDYHTPALGFSGGISFQYNFTPVISLRTNIFYEQKGSNSNIPVINIDGQIMYQSKMRTQFNQLTVPILLRVNFGRQGNFFVNAGPFMGFNISARGHLPKIDAAPSNITHQFERIDFGLSAGFGASFPISKSFAATVEVRNNLGLLNLGRDNVINNQTIKTNTTNLLVGFAYKF